MFVDLGGRLKLNIGCVSHCPCAIEEPPDIPPPEAFPLRRACNCVNEQTERERNGIQKGRFALAISGDQNGEVGAEFNGAIFKAAEILKTQILEPYHFGPAFFSKALIS